MYKKTISYIDYDGNKREEDHYFNFTKAELVEMEYSENGGLQKVISNIIATQDQPRIISLFKDLILKSYGEKSLDGKRFIKNQELREAFSQTEAYSELFMLLATDEKEAMAFINGITPPMDNIKPSVIPENK